MCTVRITSICVLLYVSYYVFRVVSSCRPSVGPSTGHIIGLIEPADSDLVTSDSACALNSCWLIFRLIFLSCFFLPFPYVSFLFFVFFLGCKYVLWIRSWYYFVACDTGWYTIARYSTAPLGIATAVHALFRFLSRRFSYLVSVLFFHGLDFRQMS